MYLTVLLGAYIERVNPELLSMLEPSWMPATGYWTIILLIYAWIASTLPVTMLLQPRDYINAWQLFVMMGLLAVGAAVSATGDNFGFVAPAVDLAPAGAPPIWPFLFITIACGAVSGFHSLVASGTSPKQISNEMDSLFVGYGSMLLEGVLAMLVLVCVAAGIGMAYKTAAGELLVGTAAWKAHYASWAGAAGLGAKLTAVVIGASNMMQKIGLPETVGITLMGVFIASFAGTTLDTSVRIQRYVIGEIATDLKIRPLANRWIATTIAVATAAALAFTTGADGKGAMTLWPLFGCANQLLASLALLVITMYLKQKGGLKYLAAAVPCTIMLVVAGWSMVVNEKYFIDQHNWLLVAIGGGVFLLAVWMTVETVILFFAGVIQPHQRQAV
jgi:carbon starvation protein